MKRLLAGIFLTLYLAVYAVGLPLTFHYCEGSLADISIITSPAEEDCCGETEDDGCCSDEEAYIKAETHHPQVVNKIEVPQASLLFLPAGFLTLPAYQVPVNSGTAYLTPFPEGPPLNHKWLIDCVIRL